MNVIWEFFKFSVKTKKLAFATNYANEDAQS